MSRPDKQYVALAGKPDGEVWLVDYRMPEGLTHRRLREAGNHDRLRIELGDIRPDATWHDALKISGVVHAFVMCGEVLGGAEDVVDVNHSAHVEVIIERAVPRGRFVSTIKGGSHHIDLRVYEQVGHGKRTDHDLGNWSDQSKAKTIAVTLSSPTADGSASRVRVLYAAKPVLNPAGKWKVCSWMSPFFYPIMSVLKKLKLA